MSKSGTGLRGASTSQNGLKATSVSGDAIFAQTTSGTHAVYGVGGASGVFGTTANGQGTGVEGFNTGSGTGVYGCSAKGIGVLAGSTSGTAIYASNDSASPTLQVNNTHNAAGQFVGGFRVVASGIYPFVATKLSDSSKSVFSVDDDGNVSYSGSLTNNATTTRGATISSYSPNSTRPTVEDTGTAQLVGGAAAVRLDPVSAAAIDMPSSYRVFVTPNGNTHVASSLLPKLKAASSCASRKAAGRR